MRIIVLCILFIFVCEIHTFGLKFLFQLIRKKKFRDIRSKLDAILTLIRNRPSAFVERDPTFSNCVNDIRRIKVDCSDYQTVRSINGTCNNLRNPILGAADTSLERALKADYVDRITIHKGYPPSRTDTIYPPSNLVSNQLFKVANETKRTSNLTVLYMTFGQFLDHDIALSPHAECNIDDCSRPDAFVYPCIPIRFEVNGQRCNPFARAIPVCRDSAKEQRNQINVLTAYVDGSQIYGSQEEFSERLRNGSRLLVNTTFPNSFTGLLPFDNEIQPCFVNGSCSLVGDERGDENSALNSLHTLWVREHNRIVEELSSTPEGSKLSEEKLFQTARSIVIAELQKIVYDEWLPQIVNLSEYRGYNDTVNPTILNSFSTAAFRFGHSLIPNSFALLDKDYAPQKSNSRISVQASFFNRQIINENGIEPIMFGLLGNRSNIVDKEFSFAIARRLFVEVGDVTRDIDLTAYNIERGRDHGIPSYTAFRKFCGLPSVNTFQDLIDNRIIPAVTVVALKSVYGSVNDIDLFVGGVSENPAEGLQVGPTFGCLIQNQFEKLRNGDRFFFRAAGILTPTQRDAIENASMARVLCNNLSGIETIQKNVFKVDSESNPRIDCSQIPQLNVKTWLN